MTGLLDFGHDLGHFCAIMSVCEGEVTPFALPLRGLRLGTPNIKPLYDSALSSCLYIYNLRECLRRFNMAGYLHIELVPQAVFNESVIV